MPKSSPTKKQPNQPFPHVPLELGPFIGGLLKVDPKKLPGKGKLTTKAAKKKATGKK